MSWRPGSHRCPRGPGLSPTVCLLAAALGLLAGTGARYVGALGPRARTERMLAELEAVGVGLERLRRALASPAGLDIGAEGAEQIAVSIVAEILSLRAGRGGGRLARMDGSIHAR